MICENKCNKKKIPAALLNCILSSLPPDSLTRCFTMLDTVLFAPGGRLSKALAQHHQASACDPLSQASWTPACTLVRNQVVCSPCFKDSSGRCSYLWLPSSTLLMTAYRTWCSGPPSSYPIISEAGGWRLWLYQVRATSHAKMAMATQCWETHQGRLEETPLSGG